MYDFTALEGKLEDVREWLAREFQSVRTGRATPTLLDAVQVTAYGSRMPLKQVANVSNEDARTLRISPWDAGLVKEVEKAIVAADLGVGTSVDETGARVTFPELTAERRGELVRFAKQKLEEARTSVRSIRDEVWSDIQRQERQGTITEDDKFRLKDELQKKIDAINTDLEQSFERKETEITNV